MGWWTVVQIVLAVISVAAAIQAKNAIKKRDRAGLGVTRFGTDQPIPVLCGERILSPIIVYQGVEDNPEQSPVNEYWFGILIWSAGENEGHGEFWLDDFTSEEFNWYPRTVPIEDAYSDYVDANYGRITTYLGDDGVHMPYWFLEQNSPTSVIPIPPDNMDNMEFRGLNVSFVRLRMDKEFKKFPQGVPEFKMLWRGVKMLDLTTGLSDSTSDNFINQAYYYLSNDRVGKGFTGWDITHMTEMANFCNTQVPFPVAGTRNLKSSNWIIDTGESVFDNLIDLLGDQGASFVDGPNGLRIEIDREKSAVMDFDDSDIIGGIKVEDIELDDTYSQVIIRFPDEENRFEISEAVYPRTDSPEHLAVKDHGKPYEEEVNSITNYYLALQRAEMLWKASQEGLNIETTLGVRAFKLEESDVITISSKLRGWDKKPFLVRELTFNGDGFRVGCSEYQPTIFPWSDKTERDEYVDTNLKNPFVLLPLSNVVFNPTFNDPATCGSITWDTPVYFHTQFTVTITNDAGSEVLQQVVYTNRIILPNLPADNYSASISTTNGVGNVINVLDFTLNTPAVPSVNVTPNNFGFLIEPVLGYSYAAARFELRINRVENVFATSDFYGEATVFDISGLRSGTEYYFWIRTINAIGESSWYSFSATTASDAEDIKDLVGIPELESDIADLELKTQSYDFDIAELFDGKTDLEVQLLDSLVNQANARELLRQKVANNENYIYAAVDVDPVTGEVTNKAFSLIDDTFSQAVVQINGVDARVTLLSEQVNVIGDDLVNLTSEVELLPGVINSVATAAVAEGIQALTPAHSFNFFDSAQGWVAVNGTLSTAVNQQIDLTHGDIQNLNLDFDAVENSAIRVTIERTAGTGWAGNLIATIDGSNVTFNAIMNEVIIGGEIVLNVDLRGNDQWVGNVTGVRLVFGTSTADEFTVSQIVIGKPDAALQELESVTSRVTIAEQEISAVDERVTTSIETFETFEESTNSQFTTVTNELDAANARISNRVFEISGVREDLEDDQIQQLLNLIDAANFRIDQTAKNVNFGDAINILRVETSELGVLSESVQQLQATTVNNGVIIQANSQSIQQARTDIEGNADALSVILSGVTGEAGTANALLQMEAYLNEGGLGARTFIGTDVNGRVTGMVTNDDGITRRIEFSSDSVLFVDDDGNNAIYYDLVNKRYYFKGAIEAEAGTFRGLIEAVEGLIAGWVIEEGVLKSSETGARIELNSDQSRISVFDATNEKVVMGYLDGLPKHSGVGNWASNDYGFWARAGDNLVIDGGIDYQSGDFLVQSDASVKIFNSTDDEILRLGTDNGSKGLFVYDLNHDKIAQFSNAGLTIGDLNGEYISWSASGGLSVSGSITSKDGSIGGWTIGENTLNNGSIYLNAASSTISIGNSITLSPNNVTFGNSFDWDADDGLTISANASIAGWKVATSVFKSADSGARIELNANANRVSIFDAVNEKVAMGYLGGLPKFDGTGNWSSNDYGFWARAGDRLVIDGGVDYQSGDFLVSNDASIRIEDGVNGNEIMRLGTDAGAKGLFIYDASKENGDATNLIAKFTDSEIYIGSSASYLSYDSSNGLQISGSLDDDSVLGSETVSALRNRVTAAKGAADDAQDDADAANAVLSDIADDNKLTPSEKQSTKLEVDRINNEYSGIVDEGNSYGLSTLVAEYTNKYNGINNYTSGLLSNLTSTSTIVGSTFRDNFNQYYTARQNLLNAIVAQAKTNLDSLSDSLGDVAYQNLLSQAYLDRDLITALGNLTPNGSTPNGTVNDLVSYSSGVVIASKNSSSGLSILQNAPTEHTIRFPDDGQYRPTKYVENLVCTGGEKYAIKFYFAVESGNTQTIQVRIDFEDIDGNLTQVVDYATQSNNAWTQYDYILSAPSDAVKINAIYLIRITNNYTGGFSYVTGLEVKRAVSGQDILDGAVEAAKLGTTIIDGGYIKTDLLDVNTILGVNATFSGTVSGGVIDGGLIQTIGSNAMIIRRATPFGPDNLIEWYGPTSGNISGGSAVLNNLTKQNGAHWMDASGEKSRDVERKASSVPSTVTNSDTNIQSWYTLATLNHLSVGGVAELSFATGFFSGTFRTAINDLTGTIMMRVIDQANTVVWEQETDVTMTGGTGMGTVEDLEISTLPNQQPFSLSELVDNTSKTKYVNQEYELQIRFDVTGSYESFILNTYSTQLFSSLEVTQ